MIGKDFEFGSEITFKCLDGYYINQESRKSNLSMFCSEDGVWTYNGTQQTFACKREL